MNRNTYDILGSMLSKNRTDNNCESITTIQDIDIEYFNNIKVDKECLTKEYITKANKDYRDGIRELNNLDKYVERYFKSDKQ